MAITINATAVVITALICLTVIILCHMEIKDKNSGGKDNG
jgi:thiamine transporter ThiT